MGVEDHARVQPSTSQAKIETSRQAKEPQMASKMPPGKTNLPSRCPFTQAAFDDIHLRKDDIDKPSVCSRIEQAIKCSKRRIWKLVSAYLPVLAVIRKYNIKENTMRDVMGGISVGTLHFPQALAFSMLASVKLENGLYTSLWPVLFYVIFGTSAHVSIGTSAVISIMTAAIVDEKAQDWVLDKPWILNQTQQGNATSLNDIQEYVDFKERVAMCVTLITGAMLTGMSLLKLGFITSYFSVSFFDAFTSAAAIHIATSQVPAILGIHVKPISGAGKLVKVYRSIFLDIHNTNVASVVIAIVCGVVIWFVKDCINERFKSKMPAPIPIELFVVIGSTLASYFGHFHENFGVKVVGSIPTGFRSPYFPMQGVDINGDDIAGCFSLAILIFVLTISMAKLCAKKHGYEIDDGQEMLAYGLCNFCSSFLRCIPSGVAPPRSMVASSMNVASTLQGLSTFALMLFFTLIGARWFSQLPGPVLAAIIVVALKRLYIQILEFRKYWYANKFDFIIWFFTFFLTIFLDINLGLASGVAVSIIIVIFQTQLAQGYSIGITLTDPWPVEHKKYKDSSEVPGVKIFKFQSSLYFANAEIFRRALYRRTIDPKKLLKTFVRMADRKLEEVKEFELEITSSNTISNNGLCKSTSAPDLGLCNSGYSSCTTINENALKQDTGPSIHNLVNSNEVDKPSPPSFLNEKTASVSADIDTCKINTASDGLKKVTNLHGSKFNFFTTSENNVVFLDDTGIDTKLHDSLSVEQPIGSVHTISHWVHSRPEAPHSAFSLGIVDSSAETRDEEVSEEDGARQLLKVHHVIIDCSSFSYVDCSGANALMQIYTDYNQVNIQLYLAGCSATMRKTMKRSGVFDKIPEENVFLDVQDAIFYASSQRFPLLSLNGQKD